MGKPVLGAEQQPLDEPVTLGPTASERAGEILSDFQNRPDEIPDDIERQNLASLQRNMDAHEVTGPAGDAGVPDSVREVLSSSGQSLDASIQRTVEDRMGDSFGDVRVHTGSKAAKACEDINARAFTVGNHIAFNSGEYDPESPEGQHLLAHELVHVRQQTGAAISMMPQEGVELEIDPDPQLEREAEETAQRVMEGGELGIQRLGGTDVHVQRWTDQPRDKIGRFDFKDQEAYPDKKYSIKHRPPYAPGQVEEVWQRAKQESPDGKVRDPNKPWIVLEWDRSEPRGDQWHMGHKEDQEYRHLLKYYFRGVISEREFVDEFQDPDHYRPEAPKENSSRKHEGDGEVWVDKFGPLPEGDDSR